MQFADSNWPNRPERVVAGRAIQPFFRLFVSNKRNDYTNKRLHHRFGLFAPRAQLLFWESASRLTCLSPIRVYACACVWRSDEDLPLVDISHRASTSRLEEPVHSLICQQVPWVCQKAVIQKAEVFRWRNSPAKRQAAGKLTGSSASPVEGAAEAFSWRASAPTCPVVSLCQQVARLIGELG